MNILVILTIIAMVIIAIGTVLFCKPVRSLIKSKTSQTDYNTIYLIAETGVGWAAQWLWNESGDTKRSEVLKYIEKECGKIGLQVDVDTMEKALEAAYRKIKAEQISAKTE